MTESTKKPVRYMDFIGGSRASSTDPLISRPVAKKSLEKKSVEKKVIKKDSSKVVVAKTSEKPMISRKPATSRDLYPTEKKTEKIPEKNPTKSSKTTDKPVDDLAKKASDALAGRKSTPAPDGNSYSLSGKSPFLPNYSIDKRPLSTSVPEKKKEENFEKLSFLGVSDSSDSSHRKNVYEKTEKSEEKGKKPKKPVKIIDDSDKKSGLPLFVIIILTIILGAAVGAGVYFLLPK